MPRRRLGVQMQARARARSQSGAVAVEFALVLPILGMLMFGIITFGLAYSDKVALANAVREGARFGASTDNVSTWGTDVVQRTVDVYANADNPLSASSVCAVLISHSGGANTFEQSSSSACEVAPGTDTPAGPAPDNPSNPSDGSCFVKVWAVRPASLNWLVTSTTVDLNADSVALYDRTPSCP
ncbi:MAG TPA: TadE/TadG family type IV pilus assembly protein [Nocardioidaceae bacterium]|nr:TadE/TadG family type IV pilus assembly protein [Nocardioidaceae bacterium]